MNRLKHLSMNNENELLLRCEQLEGLSFAQLAIALKLTVPVQPVSRKGWVGRALELALNTTAGNKSLPDFPELGIELKTLPINRLGSPVESTFVTSISLLHIHKQVWKASSCYAKLKRVLWVPIEGDTAIPFLHRRVGRAILWSPTDAEEKILEQDWLELTAMISMGNLEQLDASVGEYLQVRPKALNSKSLCYGFDESGNKVLTLPRGFYLRSSFTRTVLG